MCVNRTMKLIEHKEVLEFSTWHVECSCYREQALCQNAAL